MIIFIFFCSTTLFFENPFSCASFLKGIALESLYKIFFSAWKDKCKCIRVHTSVCTQILSNSTWSLQKQRSTISGCNLSCEAWHKYTFHKGIVHFASLTSIYNSKKVGSLEKMRCRSCFNPAGDTKLVMTAEELRNLAKLLADHSKNLFMWIDLQMETKAGLYQEMP